MKRLPTMIYVMVTVLLFLTGCSGDTQNNTLLKGPINLSSKADTEGSLLSQVVALMLETEGFQVNNKPAVAGTSLIRQAMLSGEIDIYPEYTGNGAVFFPDVDANTWKNAEQSFQTVKDLDNKRNNIIWLQPAPANNTWAIAIPVSLSEKEGIRSLEDLASYVNNSGYIKIAGSAEFFSSQVAMPAFEQAYGFALNDSQRVSLAGGNTAQTESYAANGTNGVNAAMAYGTDGSLSALNLIVLNDPKGVQPVYEPAPIVRKSVYEKYPELSTILDPVFKSLNLTTLQGLNAQIAIEGKDPREVARAYLVSKGFLK
jgi:osmoprotectant transport system substrate-binding protein